MTQKQQPITIDLLQKQIAEYAKQRDQLINQANQLDAQRKACIDNANTAHGAMISAQNILDILTGKVPLDAIPEVPKDEPKKKQPSAAAVKKALKRVQTAKKAKADKTAKA